MRYNNNYFMFGDLDNTPAFICDELQITSSCNRFNMLCRSEYIKQLFPLKCHNIIGTLNVISKKLEGFAASSLFEAHLGREILGDTKSVHFSSPGLRDDEIDALLLLCDGISFNSLSQWDRFKAKALGNVTCGLRVNPQLSFVKDKRYDPCRPQSRLGAPLDQIKQILRTDPEVLEGIEGIHFHTNCDSYNWMPLLETVQHLDSHIPSLLQQCRWINLGGGYLLDDNTNLSPFREAIRLLQDKYNLEVIIEPGAGVVRDACFLVAQVVDLFESDGTNIAVLDTTVNHMPEVFEYQFSPDVMGDIDDGQYSYILAGSTCLAGDVFGEYSFDAQLEIGSRVTFTGVGAYTLVKSHMFNGVNLPSIYALKHDGELILHKQFDYHDFKHKLREEEYDEGVRNIVANSCDVEERRSA